MMIKHFCYRRVSRPGPEQKSIGRFTQSLGKSSCWQCNQRLLALYNLHELDLSSNIIGDAGVFQRCSVPCGTVYRWNILALCGLNIISILDFRAKVVPTIPLPRPAHLRRPEPPSNIVDAPGPDTPAECLCGCAGARDAGGKVCETKKEKYKIYLYPLGSEHPRYVKSWWVGGSRRNSMRYFTQ